MIITQIQAITGDLHLFATRRLRLYKNADFTTERLIKLHDLPAKQHSNARKQASEIGFCLTQSEEYFHSAREASLATRPVLLYYGVMSLVLAEILIKKTADHRLAKLRERHAAHGLALKVGGALDERQPVQGLVDSLSATVQRNNQGLPFGTFEVWRQGVREVPVPGVVTRLLVGGTTSGPLALFVGQNTEPPHAPNFNYHLLQALQALPQLRELLVNLKLPHATVRTSLTEERQEAGGGTFQMVVHPDYPDVLQALYAAMRFHAEGVNIWKVTEMPSGLILQCDLEQNYRLPSYIQLPPSIAFHARQVLFVTNGWQLGEFGALYVALHIFGNLARYYPDIWMRHVHAFTSFALIAEELCELTLNRAPICTASELDQAYYISNG